MLWVKGYPRDLTTKQLKEEAIRLIELNGYDEHDAIIQVRGFGRSFSLEFRTAEAARDFREELMDLSPAWTDPRSTCKHELKIVGDKPLFVRLRDRLFGELWKRVLPALREHQGPNARLGQNRGKLWAILGDDCFELYSSLPDPDDNSKFTLKVATENLHLIGADEPTAASWAELALRAVA